LSSQNSKKLPYFVDSQLTIAKNLVQQTGAIISPGCAEHDSPAAVAMLEEMMAALDRAAVKPAFASAAIRSGPVTRGLRLMRQR